MTAEPAAPVATVAFLGVEVEVGPGALVPREETELLGRAALARLPAGGRFVDVCCGTGNLACALAAARPDARGWALDLTDGAVALARRNVARLGLAARVEVRQGDLLAPMAGEGPVDLVVCNPPYLSTARLAARADLAAEPREAFDGGPYGVSIHQRVAREARAVLRPGGWLACELGVGQERQLALVLQRAGGYEEIAFLDDEQGRPRVVVARLAQGAP